MADFDENYLKARIAKGDRDAFAIVFRKYYGKVYRFILSLVKNETISEDLTQDIFLKVWKKRRSFTSISSLDNYLFIAARNRSLDYFRSASRKKECLDISEEILLSIASHDVTERIDDRSLIESIKTIVNDLPQKRRDIYLMSRFDGLSNDEIASLMGITRKTVENQLSLAGSEIKKYYN